MSRAAALDLAVGGARLGALGIVLWSTAAGDPIAHARFLAQQEADRMIREPLHDWVPIGEEQEELPVLEPISRPPSYFPSIRSPEPMIDPDLPGPGKYDLADPWAKHHVFPRGGGALEGYFKQKGINIHEYTISIGEAQHLAIHRAGWNADWWAFVTAPGYKYLTKDDVLKHGEKMKRKYGIIGPYVPWR